MSQTHTPHRPRFVRAARRTLGALAVLSVAIVLTPTASALCSTGYLIRSKPVISNPALPDAEYMYTNGAGAPTSRRFRAQFWSMADGDPSVGKGADNGGFSSKEWAKPYYTYDAGGYARATRIEVVSPIGALSWAASELIDGCVADGAIDAQRCTCMMLEDGWSDGSYFALLAAQPDVGANYDFAPWTPSSVVRLARTPGPVVTAMAPADDGAHITVELAAFEGGLFVDPECGACADVRYTVHQAIVPRRSEAALDYVAGLAFKPIPGQPEQGTPVGESVELTAACGDAANEVRLAVQMRFDSGYSTRYVSGDTWRLHCDSDVSRPAKPAPRARPVTRGGADRKQLERKMPGR